MKFLALLFIASAGCAPLGRGPTTAPATSPAIVFFESQTAGLRFTYPDSWHPAKDDTVLSLVPAGESVMGLNTLVIEKPDLPPHIPGFIPIGLVEAGFVNDLKKRYKDVKVSLSANRTVDGVVGREVHAAGRRGDGEVIVVALLCVHGDAVYIVNAETTDAQATSARAAWDTVVNSIQWMD